MGRDDAYDYHSIHQIKLFPLDSQDYKTEVNEDDLEVADENFCKERTPFGCREEFSDLILLIMEDNNLSMAVNIDEAEQLYVTLLTELQSLL